MYSGVVKSRTLLFFLLGSLLLVIAAADSTSSTRSSVHANVLESIDKHCNKDDQLNVLLLSDRHVLKQLKKTYPNYNIQLLDYEPDAQKADNAPAYDLAFDICETGTIQKDSYDLIITDSVLEHLYSPYGAHQNMWNGLKSGAVLVSHTHGPTKEIHKDLRRLFPLYERLLARNR